MNKKTQKVNPVLSAAAGAVVGAGLGMAAGAAANDAKTRKQVENVVKTVKKQAEGYIKSIDTKKSMEEVEQVARDAIAKASKNKKAASVVKKVQGSTKKANHK